MKKETEMKSNVLQQLIEAMLGETGGKMKPKVMSVEIIHGKPKEGLEEVLEHAAEEAPEMGEPIDMNGDGKHDEKDHEMADEDDEEYCEGGEAKKPRMSLSQFLANR